MPDFATLVTTVTDFMATWAVFAAAGAAIGLMVYGVRKMIKAGR